MKIFENITYFVVCLLIMLVVSVNRDGRLLGYDLARLGDKQLSAENLSVESIMADTLVVNTSELGKDIHGYGGRVPLEIRIVKDTIVSVVALSNSETPDFFEDASALLNQWDGMSLADAMSRQVDAVSGATYSSEAIKGNMKAGIAYAISQKETQTDESSFHFSVGWLLSVIVVLAGAIIPLFVKSKTYRVIQHLLDIIILGFWTGTFVSYSQMVGYLSNGVNLLNSLPVLLLLVVAFIYPLFGRKKHYCSNLCPFGALQEEISRFSPWRIMVPKHLYEALHSARRGLWVALTLLMLTGVWFDWMNYEVFSAFLVQAAGVGVIIFALFFVILSFFVGRPYCRFVCPTGTLMKLSERS